MQVIAPEDFKAQALKSLRFFLEHSQWDPNGVITQEEFDAGCDLVSTLLHTC